MEESSLTNYAARQGGGRSSCTFRVVRGGGARGLALGPGAQGSGSGAQGLGAWGRGPGARDAGPGAQGLGALGLGPRAQGWGRGS